MSQLGFKYCGELCNFKDIDTDPVVAAALTAFLIKALADATCYVMHHGAAGPPVGTGSTVGKCIDFSGVLDHLEVFLSYATCYVCALTGLACYRAALLN